MTIAIALLFLAQAAVPAPPDLDLSQFGALALKLAGSGQWAALAVLLYVAVVFLVRFLLAKHLADALPWPPVSRTLAWLNTDRGGVLLNILTAAATVLGGALVAGASITPGLVIAALLTACLGGGAWNMVKKIVAPADQAHADVADEKARLERVVSDLHAQIAQLEQDTNEPAVRARLNALLPRGP